MNDWERDENEDLAEQGMRTLELRQLWKFREEFLQNNWQ